MTVGGAESNEKDRVDGERFIEEEVRKVCRYFVEGKGGTGGSG